jgi:hypothetical protein
MREERTFSLLLMREGNRRHPKERVLPVKDKYDSRAAILKALSRGLAKTAVMLARETGIPRDLISVQLNHFRVRDKLVRLVKTKCEHCGSAVNFYRGDQ